MFSSRVAPRSYPHLFNLYDWEKASDVSGNRNMLETWESLIAEDDLSETRKLGVIVSGGIHSYTLISVCRIYGLLPKDARYIAVTDAEYASYCLSRGAILLWDGYDKLNSTPLVTSRVLLNAQDSRSTWTYCGDVSDETVSAIGTQLVCRVLDGIFDSDGPNYPLSPSLAERLSLEHLHFEMKEPLDQVRLYRISHYIESVLPPLTSDLRLEPYMKQAKMLAAIRSIWEEMLSRKSIKLSYENLSLDQLAQDTSYFSELAEFTGADVALNALWSGVPLEDILA